MTTGGGANSRMDSIRHPLSGAGWTLFGYAATRLISVGATLALARLLEPDDFGVVALALVVVTTVMAVSQLGLGGAIVLVEQEPATLPAALTLLVAGGVAGAALVLATAHPIALLFDVPRLEPVLRAFSLMPVISGITTFFEAVLQRELRFRARFITQLIQAVMFACIAIVLAAVGAGVWSLVIGYLSAAAAYAAALAQRAPYRVRPGLAVGELRRSLRPAGGFMAQRVLDHVQNSIGTGAAGYVLGAGAAGQYSMTYRLADLPYQALTDPMATATFPALGRKHRGREPIVDLSMEFLSIVAFFALPAGLLLSATAGPLVETILGTKWEPAGTALAVLGIWSAVAQVEAALGWIMVSTGRAGLNAKIEAAAIVPLVPCLILGAEAWGLRGVAWIMLIGTLATTGAIVLYVRSRLGISLRQQGATLAGAVFAGAAAWLSAKLVVEISAGASAQLTVVAALLCGLLTYLVGIWLIAPATLRRVVVFVREAVAAVRSGEVDVAEPRAIEGGIPPADSDRG